MDTMLSRALREFLSGPLHQLLVNLGGRDGERIGEELNKFNRREPCWLPEAKVPAKKRRQGLLGPPQIVEVDGKKFRLQELLVPAKNATIIKALGGLERARVERADLDRFLETADKNKWYLCFIGEGAACVDWCGGDWDLDASAVENPDEWSDGDMVFSRH